MYNAFECVFQGHGHLEAYSLGYALVVFRRDMLGLYMWGRGEVCVCWRDEVLCFYRGVGDVHFLV